MKLEETTAALAAQAAKGLEGHKIEVAEATQTPSVPSTGPNALSGKTTKDAVEALLG